MSRVDEEFSAVCGRSERKKNREKLIKTDSCSKHKTSIQLKKSQTRNITVTI